MYAWIPLLAVALLFTGLHKFFRKVDKEYRELELTKGKGVVTATSQESNRKYIYVQFKANGKTYEERVHGSYSLDSPYCQGHEIPIGYYLRSNGVATVFIDDEDLEKNKNGSDSKLLLNIAIGMYIAAGAFFVYFLLNL